MAVIEARGLTYTYPESKKPALVDVDLVVEEGEFVILTGPSGCGKTTLCRCLNGLIPHFYGGELKGELYVAGMNVKEHKTWELAQHVGLVFQNPENQLFSLTVEKDVAFGPENLGLPRDEIRNRVDWALDRTGTTPLRYRAPYELSGGQQQRVAIASTLAMKPKVLVLDEPTSFLDPRGAQRIFETVNRLNKELKAALEKWGVRTLPKEGAGEPTRGFKIFIECMILPLFRDAVRARQTRVVPRGRPLSRRAGGSPHSYRCPKVHQLRDGRPLAGGKGDNSGGDCPGGLRAQENEV